ncbi:MAG: methyltransferase domain-containing protein [bacterium]
MSKAEHDARAAHERGTVKHYDRPWYRSASSVLTRRGLRGLRCLDLCAGNAEFSELLRDQFGMKVTCADYAPAHLAHQQALGFDTLHVDLDADASEVDRVAKNHAGTFDLVVSLATIEHVFDSDNFLRLCHTVLKPGGMLLVNTPNISYSGYRLYSLCSGNRPFGEGHHVRFWDFRFLRTNLFLNGFSVIEDGRQFHSLPADPLTRAFRGRKWLANSVAWLFHACRFLQHLPGGKHWFADELTILAEKDDAYPVGFSLARVKSQLNQLHGRPEEPLAIQRLKNAQQRGWLREHLMLNDMAQTCREAPSKTL